AQRQEKTSAKDILAAQTAMSSEATKVKSGAQRKSAEPSMINAVTKNTLFRQIVRQVFRDLMRAIMSALGGKKK
ncbi:MAG: DUF853 family protein, partial [Legionella sp.]